MLIDYLNDKQRALIFAPGIEHGKYGNKKSLIPVQIIREPLRKIR
jgi:hypothetical protein